MDGENNSDNPYFLMDKLGGKRETHSFRKPPQNGIFEDDFPFPVWWDMYPSPGG